MTERDRRQWAAFERVVASNACDSEKATAQNRLDALRAKYGQRPPEPEVRLPGGYPWWEKVWPGAGPKVWAENIAAATREANRRAAQDAHEKRIAIAAQRERVRAVPHWQDIGGLGDLYRARHVWTRDEERRFKELVPRS